MLCWMPFTLHDQNWKAGMVFLSLQLLHPTCPARSNSKPQSLMHSNLLFLAWTDRGGTEVWEMRSGQAHWGAWPWRWHMSFGSQGEKHCPPHGRLDLGSLACRTGTSDPSLQGEHCFDKQWGKSCFSKKSQPFLKIFYCHVILLWEGWKCGYLDFQNHLPNARLCGLQIHSLKTMRKMEIYSQISIFEELMVGLKK